MDLNGIRARTTPDIDRNQDQRVDAAEIGVAIDKLQADPDLRQMRDTLATFESTGRLDPDTEAEIAASGWAPDSPEAKEYRRAIVTPLEETVRELDQALKGLRELAAEVQRTPEGSLPLMAPEFYARFGQLEAKVRDFMMQADWQSGDTADGMPTTDEVTAYADSLAKTREADVDRLERGADPQKNRRSNPTAFDNYLRELKAKVADIRDTAAKACGALAEPASGAGGVGIRRPNDR
jgi:hypothetical protein